MRSFIRKFLLVSMGAALVSVAVALMLPANQLSVGELLTNSGGYEGKEVTVTGVAAGGVAVLGIGGYRLRDPSGEAEILVISEAGVPQTGTTVKVQGTYKQLLSVGAAEQGVVVPTSWCNGSSVVSTLVPAVYILCAAPTSKFFRTSDSASDTSG